VAQTPAKAALEELAKLVRPYKEDRNLHVHRGRLQPIAEVMGSKLLDQLKLISFVERVGKPVVPSAILEKGYSIEIPKISGRLDQERADVTARVVTVFDGLYRVYRQKSEELHEKWRPVIEKKAELARLARSGPTRPEG
jgi:catalase (peroxidase I)